jgi:uncharacterized Zn-binding protein involved in type VI secretion
VAHVVRADLSKANLQLALSVGRSVKETDTIEEMARTSSRDSDTLIAAINGDYFEYQTEPRYHGTLQGTAVVDGELVSTPGFPTMWVDGEGKPHMATVQSALRVHWPDGSSSAMAVNASPSDFKSEVRAAGVVLFTPTFAKSTGSISKRELVLVPADEGAPWLPLKAGATYRARVRSIESNGDTPIAEGAMVLSIAQASNDDPPAIAVGDVLTLDTSCSPALTDATMAVAGSPRLLMDGEPVAGLDDTHRAPRTAIGFVGQTVLLVVVDGRREGWSIGMTHAELARFMKKLGCTDAINLDGGGSSSLWYRGQTISSPSGGQPRAVGSAVILRVRRER